MDRTADVLIHLPRSKLFSGFPFLLKKLRFLHDIHLLKFMTERKSFLTKKKRKRKRGRKQQKQIRNRKRRWRWWWVSERGREKRERGSRGVRAFIECAGSVLFGVLGRVVRCDITRTCSHAHTNTRQEGEKSD